MFVSKGKRKTTSKLIIHWKDQKKNNLKAVNPFSSFEYLMVLYTIINIQPPSNAECVTTSTFTGARRYKMTGSTKRPWPMHQASAKIFHFPCSDFIPLKTPNIIFCHACFKKQA
jgi:hypothetical protein